MSEWILLLFLDLGLAVAVWWLMKGKPGTSNQQRERYDKEP